MERNDFPAGGPTEGAAGGSGATGSFGNAGGTSGTEGYGASAASGSIGSTTGNDDASIAQSDFAGQSQSQSQSIKDRARDIAGNAQEKLADVGSSVRDRAGNAKNSLADMLDSGANRLRQRASSDGQLAGATTAGSATIAEGRAAQVTDRVASGMSATADFIREADLESLQSGIERQVKEHPGRTLLMAVGLGYLLGKAIRK